jgi:beta-aspartyl-peptidase (threonine type)
MTATILTSHEGLYGISGTIDGLTSGRPTIDALEAGIKMVENDHRARTVGFGGAPTILGTMQLDASIMDGGTLKVGAVGAIEGCKHPITAARKVLETLPHVFLVGEGASRFAREMGIEQSDMLYDESKTAYRAWLDANLSAEQRQNIGTIPLVPFISFNTRSDLSRGTVTFLVRDSLGNLYGGVSTSGWAYKYPGRLGDSPVIGSGMYVDNRYGGAACTHTGEMTIRAGTARSVVLYMKKGATVQEAVQEAVNDLRDLKGGYLGPVIIHAIDRHGEHYVVTTGGDEGDSYCLWREGMTTFEKRRPILAA